MPDRSWPSLAGREEGKGQTRVWTIQGQAGPSTVTLISYLSFSDCQQSFCFCFFLSVSLFPSNNHILYLGFMSLKCFLFVSAWLARPLVLQDVSPPTRDWTGRLALKAPSPHHWATREFLCQVFLIQNNIPPFSPLLIYATDLLKKPELCCGMFNKRIWMDISSWCGLILSL